LFIAGEQDAIAFSNAQRDYNDSVRRYRDALIRHRRSTLSLNTTIGLRILP
jgi:cobalt-zinc-cadmium efflux system outer membrane protein